jgi:hypothetical protein
MKSIVMFVLALSASLLLDQGHSYAASEDAACTVTGVTWNNNSLTGQKMLYVQCADNNTFFAYLAGGATCPALDIDSIKMWQSTAQAAKLSGKTLNVWYNQCPSSTTNSITSLEFKGL